MKPQIIIPMSGFGERFRAAGYNVPKPLIEVDGKPMIEYVVDLFPSGSEFIFICNRDHLAVPEYKMAETLRRIAPGCLIEPIDAHRLGPVHAVLKAARVIDPQRPVIINYCDFTCYWDFDDFARFVVQSDCDGCIPAYRGFHPHSVGSTYYAYIRQDGLWLEDIREKQPFTDRPTDEYASSGTYWFRTGRLCLDALQEQVRQGLDINGEYYVSLAYRPLKTWGLKTAIYELQHFMQWGTPADLRQYMGWSRAFRRLATPGGDQVRHSGSVLLPMAGLGKRFADAGYELPKPLVPVSGRPMVIQAVRDLPAAAVQRFVLRNDLPSVDAIERKLRASFVGAEFVRLDSVTEGQAVTCRLGTEGLDREKPVTVGACDNGILYDADALAEQLQDGSADLLVWVVRGHADGQLRPTMFGWIDEDEHGHVTGVRVKSAPQDPAGAAMIIGTFTFRRLEDLERMVDALVNRAGRVNGEYYLDSVIEDCLAAGLNVRLFEIDAYIGWGTPADLQVFEYWQSCFHKWSSHTYRLERDRRVPASAVAALSERFASLPAPRPAGVRTVEPVKPFAFFWRRAG